MRSFAHRSRNLIVRMNGVLLSQRQVQALALCCSRCCLLLDRFEPEVEGRSTDGNAFISHGARGTMRAHVRASVS